MTMTFQQICFGCGIANPPLTCTECGEPYCTWCVLEHRLMVKHDHPVREAECMRCKTELHTLKCLSCIKKYCTRCMIGHMRTTHGFDLH